ncbi:hypothetical protein [Pseudomonas sp. 4810-S13]
MPTTPGPQTTAADFSSAAPLFSRRIDLMVIGLPVMSRSSFAFT